MFWRLLGELSRRDGVTIFVSTHFMNEAERCDRVSLMHAGKVLAVGTPEELRQAKHAADLEDAFVAYLEEADPDEAVNKDPHPALATPPGDRNAHSISVGSLHASLRRIWAFAYRETRELLRDWVRLSFALLGPLVLLLTFGYGITFDVENLSFAVLDRDQSADSRQLIESFAASRYFRQKPALHSETDIDRRLRAGDLRLVISIPPGYGRDLNAGRRPPARGCLLPRRRHAVSCRDHAQLCGRDHALLCGGPRAPDLWRGAGAGGGVGRAALSL
jgi:ribosome-dependent ATPase